MRLLDTVLPSYDVVERHDRVVRATAERVRAAFFELTLAELPVARFLFGVRSLPDRVVGRHGLPSRRDAPLVDQFTDSGFSVLAQDQTAVVIGTIASVKGAALSAIGPVDAEQFQAFDVHGYVKVAMGWTFHDGDTDTALVVTETRVLATSDGARRTFGRYWALIGPFSGLIRREWLAALARRVEP